MHDYGAYKSALDLLDRLGYTSEAANKAAAEASRERREQERLILGSPPRSTYQPIVNTKPDPKAHATKPHRKAHPTGQRAAARKKAKGRRKGKVKDGLRCTIAETQQHYRQFGGWRGA